MNLCLIYLTEWVKEWAVYVQYPQRWVMGIDQDDVDLSVFDMAHWTRLTQIEKDIT